MDKIKIIEDKIESFFNSKVSFKDRINSIESLSLQLKIYHDNGEKLMVSLYKNNNFLTRVELKDVLKLTLIEKFATNEEAIEKILIEGLKKHAKENEVRNYEVVLIVKSNKTYFIQLQNFDKNYSLQEININQIIQ